MDENYQKRRTKKAIAKQVQNGNGGGTWVPSTEDLEMYAVYSRLTKTQQQIADEHNISQQAVSAKVKKVNLWLWKANIREIKSIKSGHIQHLMHIAREAMQGWEKSKLVGVTKSEKTGTGPMGDTSEVATIRKEQCGEPRYLETTIKALEGVRKITGADIPMEITPEEDVRFAGQSREQAVLNTIERLQARLVASEN